MDEKSKFLRLPEVLERTGLSRSTIYLMISRGEFPRPVALGVRAVGWQEKDVAGWADSKILAARKGGK